MDLMSARQVAAELFLASPRTVETWAARGQLQSYGGLFVLEEAIEVEARLRRRPRRAALLDLAGNGERWKAVTPAPPNREDP